MKTHFAIACAEVWQTLTLPVILLDRIVYRWQFFLSLHASRASCVGWRDEIRRHILHPGLLISFVNT